jgi:hypothetical protein
LAKSPSAAYATVGRPKDFAWQVTQGNAIMRITFEASEISTPISRTFAALTNMAEICINNIQHDEENGIVEIPMKRREVIEQKRKGCLGLFLPTYIAGYTWFDSKLIIRQVIELKMDVDDLLIAECDACFSAMMGLKIDDHELYLGSLEEASGKTLCQIFIKVNKFDLELIDLAQFESRPTQHQP